jgi:hypothetical protein
VLSELPDLDEDVSFVVDDDGNSTGPLSMRAIAKSIVSGDRLPSALVWWDGATDWIYFESHDGLAALLQGEAAEVEDSDEAEEFAAEEFDPRSLHPSFQWGVTAQSRAVKPAEIDVEDAPEVEHVPMHQMATLDQFDQSHFADKAITGLFGAVARVDGGLSAQATTSAPPADDAALAAPVSLQSVGARIEALASATRRSHSLNVRFDTDNGTESETALLASVSSEENEIGDQRGTTPDAFVDGSGEGSWQAVDGAVAVAVAETEAAADASSVASTSAVESLTARFAEMVRTSKAHQRRIEWVMRVDELLLSACITAIADSGFVASDLSSEESDHLVFFDHNDDSRRVRLELAPLDLVSDQLGRHVRFSLGWGRDVADLAQAMQTVSEHGHDGVAPSGSVTCEADHEASTVSTKVVLIWAADDFVKDDYSVDRPSLDSSIAAALHALESRWRELFVAT